MARCAAGSVMMLAFGVSIRIFPALDCHMRDGDCTGGLPPAGCVLVAHSEHAGGVGGAEARSTVPQFSTPAFPTSYPKLSKSRRHHGPCLTFGRDRFPKEPVRLAEENNRVLVHIQPKTRRQRGQQQSAPGPRAFIFGARPHSGLLGSHGQSLDSFAQAGGIPFWLGNAVRT
jgi:hypothetical protein